MILGIDHVGIAVSDAGAAVGTFADLVGRVGTHVEEVDGQAVRVAFVPAAWAEGGARLELLAPTDASGAVARFLERRGEGLHHVCLVTDDLEAEIGRLAPRFQMVDAVPRRGHGGRVAFLHPRGAHGVLVELLERDRVAALDGDDGATGRRAFDLEGQASRSRTGPPVGAEAWATELLSAARAGDRRALSRALSAVESGSEVGRAIVAAARATGAAPSTAAVVGITGAPGAGKSTLVGALAQAWRSAEPDAAVAVLAIDPSSPVTGGAVLGDRVRMGALAGDPNAFVRSVAGRGAGEGLADAAGGMLDVLRAAGFGTVLLETVGVGQDAIAVGALADVTVVVHAPGLGDSIQGLKAGLVDLADVIAVNKADLDGAAAMASGLRFGRGEGATCPVMEVSATTGAGVAELRAAIGSALARPRDHASTERARAAAIAAIVARVRSALRDGTAGATWVSAVASGQVGATDAARAILGMSGVPAVGPGADGMASATANGNEQP